MNRSRALACAVGLLVPGVAGAGFAPDRPGLGSSTGVVPQHKSMIEAGIALGGLLGTPPVLALPGLMGRIGLPPERLELRIGAPGLVMPFQGPLVGTPLTAGVKWVGGDTIGWSVIPTVAIPLPGNPDPLGVVNTDLEGNVAWSASSNEWGLWGTGHGGAGRDSQWAGAAAGAWYNPGGVGLYANSGWEGGFVLGGGGWWELSRGVQSDLGVDVWPGLPAAVAVRAGVSVQR